MSIANEIERLQTAKTDLKTAIMAKGVEVADTDTIDTYASKVEAIESGKGIDLMSYVSSATMSLDLSEVTEDIVMHLERASSISNMFSGVPFGCSKLTLYISNKCKSFFRAIRLGGDCALKEIEIVGDTSNVNHYGAAFFSQFNLERIIGVLDFSSATSSGSMNEIVGQCSKLQKITPKANTIKISISFSYCPNLTDETIQAIINGLADLTGATAQTITFHKDVKAKLTDNQITTITNKNWTLA